ncbi:MAG TPA: c-type cytochrome [Blastocatellia bacterium]|jgi:hypothetical protein|nr:c-type cytochrome [Blastocatellia bacterium]
MQKSKVSRIVRSTVLSLSICLSIAGWLTEGSKAGEGMAGTTAGSPLSGFERDTATRPQEKKAEEAFKNIQVLKGIPASQVMGAMSKIASFLGTDCAHCHVPGEFDKDDKQPKQVARTMFKMVRTISTELSTNKVTCYTCHRGHVEPERMPAEMRAKADEDNKKADEDKRPVEDAFKNIQSLKGITAGRLMATMNGFTRSLGVDCSFCHVPGAFEKDDKANKLTARKMLAMTGVVAKEYFNGRGRVNCYTCHRGQKEPVSMPPPQ